MGMYLILSRCLFLSSSLRRPTQNETAKKNQHFMMELQILMFACL